MYAGIWIFWMLTVSATIVLHFSVLITYNTIIDKQDGNIVSKKYEARSGIYN